MRTRVSGGGDLPRRRVAGEVGAVHEDQRRVPRRLRRGQQVDERLRNRAQRSERTARVASTHFARHTRSVRRLLYARCTFRERAQHAQGLQEQTRRRKNALRMHVSVQSNRRMHMPQESWGAQSPQESPSEEQSYISSSEAGSGDELEAPEASAPAIPAATSSSGSSKRSSSKRSTAKRSTAKRSSSKRSSSKRSSTKRSTAKRSTAKRSTAKRSTAKRSTAKRSTAKRSTSKR